MTIKKMPVLLYCFLISSTVDSMSSDMPVQSSQSIVQINVSDDNQQQDFLLELIKKIYALNDFSNDQKDLLFNLIQGLIQADDVPDELKNDLLYIIDNMVSLNNDATVLFLDKLLEEITLE